LQEIARLCRITPPDFAVALNVLPVHLEHLGSIERIQQAKAELVEGMKPNGIAILNADDKRVLAMREKSKGKTITYGIANQADVFATDIKTERFGETGFKLHLPSGAAKVLFSLNGRHNILNALAASAVGFLFGMSAEEISVALETVAPPPQRGEILHFRAGFTVINDSYNSNPDALISMVKTLIDGSTKTARKIVVAGEMLELGAEQTAIHREVGQVLAGSGIDWLIGVRGLAEEMTKSAKENGLNETSFFENSEKAGEFLASEIKTGDLVLVKGSRGVRTEKVIEKLLEKFDLERGEEEKKQRAMENGGRMK
jgi:UDP-N-acetylmuramoyl-tripeptide--D-alanyl-D-alanine ligase